MTYTLFKYNINNCTEFTWNILFRSFNEIIYLQMYRVLGPNFNPMFSILNRLSKCSQLRSRNLSNRDVHFFFILDINFSKKINIYISFKPVWFLTIIYFSLQNNQVNKKQKQFVYSKIKLTNLFIYCFF